MSSTAGDTTEEELATKEADTDRTKEEDSAATGSVVSETTSESTSIAIMPVNNIPISHYISKEPQHQQQPETETKTEDRETEQETMEQAIPVEEQEEDGGDDDMAAISESAATSEVIVDDDDDDDEATDIADEPEEVMMEAEEVVEEEECDEEVDDEEDEDVDIEGFESAHTGQTMEADAGMSKSDPIELSSDEESERIPPVMLSSTVRSVDL